ncbi:hypothetical protein ABZ807_13660 [Micromonospora sp. NPDC047548]|uniref:hypothetical protein n=1 Tax=Micromonospora sp. NPDC047548 TaxID=3155624 RepID=UPI0033E3D7DF
MAGARSAGRCQGGETGAALLADGRVYAGTTVHDLGWSHGQGAPLRGLAQDLLLVLCGRRLPLGRLDGAAATRFSRPG